MDLWAGDDLWEAGTEASSSNGSDSGDEMAHFAEMSNDSDFLGVAGTSSVESPPMTLPTSGESTDYEDYDSDAADSPWAMPRSVPSAQELWQQQQSRVVMNGMVGAGAQAPYEQAAQDVYDWYAEQEPHSDYSAGYSSGYSSSGAGDFVSGEDREGSTSDGTIFDERPYEPAQAALAFPLAPLDPLTMSNPADPGAAIHSFDVHYQAPAQATLAPVPARPPAAHPAVAAVPASAPRVTTKLSRPSSGPCKPAGKPETGAGATCPLCVRTCQEQHRLGVFWRKFGYEGPAYCSRCASVFRAHTVTCNVLPETCTRDNPCEICAGIIVHFKCDKKDAFKQMDIAEPRSRTTYSARAKHPTAAPTASDSTAPTFGDKCPVCDDDSTGQLGLFWRKFGYSGPAYCPACSSGFRNHIIRQRRTRGTKCSRTNPCKACAQVLAHFPGERQEVFANMDVAKQQKTDLNGRVLIKHQRDERDEEHMSMNPFEATSGKPIKKQRKGGGGAAKAKKGMALAAGLAVTAVVSLFVSCFPTVVTLTGTGPGPEFAQEVSHNCSHVSGRYFWGNRDRELDSGIAVGHRDFVSMLQCRSGGRCGFRCVAEDPVETGGHSTAPYGTMTCVEKLGVFAGGMCRAEPHVVDDHIAQLKAQVGPTSGYQPMQPLQADGGLYRNQPNDYFNNNRYGVPPAEKLHGEASRTSFTEKLQPPPGAMASRGLPILYPPTPDHELIRRGVQTGYLATCVESSWKEELAFVAAQSCADPIPPAGAAGDAFLSGMFSDPGWSALGTYNGQLVQPTCFCMESLGNGAGVPVEQTGMVDHSGMGSMTRETWDMPASTYQQLANQIESAAVKAGSCRPVPECLTSRGANNRPNLCKPWRDPRSGELLRKDLEKHSIVTLLEWLMATKTRMSIIMVAITGNKEQINQEAAYTLSGRMPASKVAVIGLLLNPAVTDRYDDIGVLVDGDTQRDFPTYKGSPPRG